MGLVQLPHLVFHVHILSCLRENVLGWSLESLYFSHIELDFWIISNSRSNYSSSSESSRGRAFSDRAGPDFQFGLSPASTHREGVGAQLLDLSPACVVPVRKVP